MKLEMEAGRRQMKQAGGRAAADEAGCRRRSPEKVAGRRSVGCRRRSPEKVAGRRSVGCRRRSPEKVPGRRRGTKLPTKLNLEKHGVSLVSLSCPFCNSFDENEDHIFRDCAFSNSILKEETTRRFSMGVLYTFFWVIWKARNNKVFSDSSLRKENCLIAEIQALSFYWIKHRGRMWDAIQWSSWCCDPLNTA
ncbi:hypothetical protein OSB04_004960 [Centaurea solstitialis]|uniref:Reverse transcriptase zinc-binding domain-containing protein n=1 Tax=Centaurea solstitialis TaxID=347529 RepID=A0AA38TF30_9ASTR|nr:hypothetical protein OSB04_004960 [Centaurea solstitialis]